MDQKQRCLHNMSVFSNLNEEEISLICQKAVQRNYEKGQFIFFENDNDKKLYLLSSGRVKLTIMSPEGREKVLTILQEGDIFGEISFFDHNPHPVTAEVVEDTLLLVISWSDLEKIIMQKPSLALKIIEALAKKTRLLTSQIREMVFQDAGGRLAAMLQRFAGDFGQEVSDGIRIELVLTHQEIANLLGTSRVTVTKFLNNFMDRKIIRIENRKIIILDSEALENEIEFI